MLTVSLVNTNNGKILKDCLKSIYENKPECEFEVFVVDNGSTDCSQEMIKAEFPQVQLRENHRNCGFPFSNNRAFKESKGKYFLLLNDDTIVPPGAFDKMVEFMESHPDCGISGVKLVFPDGSVQSCKFSFPTLLKEFFHINVLVKRLLARSRKLMWFIRRIYYSLFSQDASVNQLLDYDSVHEVDDVLGACFLVRRKVFDDIGLFDETYFTCRDETDFAYRAKQKGWKIYYNPDVTIVHLGGATVSRLNVTYFCQDKISANYFFGKYYPKPKCLLLKIIYLEGFLVSMLFESLRAIIFVFSPSRRREALGNLGLYIETIPKILFDRTETAIK